MMESLYLLCHTRPNGIFAQNGDTDALIQLFIMFIIMAFAIIGNILKARSEASKKAVKKPSRPYQQEPRQQPSSIPSPVHTPEIQQQQHNEIPYFATTRTRDIHRHPYKGARRQQRLPRPSPSQPLPEMEKESLGLKEKAIVQKSTPEVEVPPSVLKLMPTNLRQAILLHEILGRPLSLREQDDRLF